MKLLAVFLLLSPLVVQERSGRAIAEAARPASFPHRVWAACDFEGQTLDYAWFGLPERSNIPEYAGNATALRAEPRPYKNFSARMVGMNPVPGPVMGKSNFLYCRYLLKGTSRATFQHFSLTSNDNNHIEVSGLVEGRWAEVTLNFTRDARRNDGSPGAIKEGERMDDLKVFVGKPGDGKEYEILLDDVIFFALDADLPAEPEPFPNRVIFAAAFDTGVDPKVKEKYYPGQLEIVRKDAPPGTWWGAARAVPRKDGKGRWIQLKVDPPRPVGARTKLRFRYHLKGSTQMTAQVFDCTDGDNRHVRLRDLKQEAWTFAVVDFTRDGKRNDGKDTPFTAGHRVDDLFFFVEEGADLLVDEVALFDARER